jgi:nucleoside-diphosphate-sugar epimerase
MKIAITGHTAGIGQALAQAYQEEGHTIVGLSRGNGFNIRSTPKVADVIEVCDMFINNAQVGYAQTELLLEVHKRWISTPKRIVVISTMLAQFPATVVPGLEEYHLQKRALEDAVAQLRYKMSGPQITLVRPGMVATHPELQEGADPALWARVPVSILRMADANNLDIPDISLGQKL